MEKKTVNAWRVVAVIAMILCLALAIWCVSLVSRNRAETKQPIGDGEVLASWASDSVARDALIS